MSKTKNSSKAENVSRGKRKAEALQDEPMISKKKPATEREVASRPTQTNNDKSFSMIDASLMSDHLAKVTKKWLKDSSTIELEDSYIPAKAFQDSSSFSESRLAQHLPTFLKEYSSGGAKELSSCKQTSSPHTIVITASGIRAADLTRELRVFAKEDSKVAKLFAKHMKLKESIAFVEKTRFGIAVGSPSRLKELLEQDVIKTEDLKRIVIDASYIDEKKRTIFDMKEIFMPMLDILNQNKIKSRYGDGVEILLF